MKRSKVKKSAAHILFARSNETSGLRKLRAAIPVVELEDGGFDLDRENWPEELGEAPTMEEIVANRDDAEDQFNEHPNKDGVLKKISPRKPGSRKKKHPRQVAREKRRALMAERWAKAKAKNK